jgi:hypothetical protein
LVRAAQEVLEQLDRGLSALGAAFDPELVTAPSDGDIEFGLHLPQVDIERTRDVREVVIVDVRREGQDFPG